MNQKKFIFLDHTADAKFKAFGKTLEDAFLSSANALISLMWDRDKIKNSKKIAVQIIAKDEKQLLVNFLEEIIYLLDTGEFLLKEVSSIQIRSDSDSFILDSVFNGDLNRSEYEIYGEVKAVTYSEMEISNHQDGWIIQVVVDL